MDKHTDEIRNLQVVGLTAFVFGWILVAWGAWSMFGFPGLSITIGLPFMAWGLYTILSMSEAKVWMENAEQLKK